ncbi:hypothetical protein B9Z55_026075 [Caenorhabditis nigoni]|uniref:Uncharacterized protein n=1 Tax=Caenorhabditis nigoni TaxID=1611254 RepID=A0A2G5T1G2_9PELO|nr:hypothetical protein B9Z55_026075 [Caenorhabditis nigoni]
MCKKDQDFRLFVNLHHLRGRQKIDSFEPMKPKNAETSSRGTASKWPQSPTPSSTTSIVLAKIFIASSSSVRKLEREIWTGQRRTPMVDIW